MEGCIVLRAVHPVGADALLDDSRRRGLINAGQHREGGGGGGVDVELAAHGGEQVRQSDHVGVLVLLVDEAALGSAGSVVEAAGPTC